MKHVHSLVQALFSLVNAWSNSLAITCFVIVIVLVGMPLAADTSEDSENAGIFARDNLVAWCIVPFDAKQRGPEERAAMLSKLGLKKFAYDYRAEHISTFEEEIAALNRNHIELTAWWFPGTLNDEARGIIALLKKNNIRTQLWVTGGGEPTKNDDEYKARVEAEAARIRPIAEEAAKIGCRVGLYNHGGWFGEPENQIAIIKTLELPNVGIVYNLHHGHSHMDRFPELLRKMLPYLYAINLNGMVRQAEPGDKKILPIGQGERDLEVLKTIRDSGYQGPIGILGHTQDDAEMRLLDNIEGLEWLVKQIDGNSTMPRPQPRTLPLETSVVPIGNATVVSATHSTEQPATDVAPNAALGCNVMAAAEYNATLAADLAAEATKHGNVRNGVAVFCSARFACLNCHRVGKVGGTVGPELTDVGRRLQITEIVESIVWPKRQVKPEFCVFEVLLQNGHSIQGYKREDTPDLLKLFDPTNGELTSVNKSEIEEIGEVGTLMPEGLASAMTRVQLRDLVRFLHALENEHGLANAVREGGTVAEFTYDRAPLVSTDWPQWQLPVNRDRIYDFYAKQAIYFRKQPHAHLLPAFPGLDGGTFGHWGNQNDDTWKDDRWNDSDFDSVLAGVFRAGDKVITKGVCVRLGEHGELATCFNPETLTYDALWHGGFLKFSSFRHGFLDGLNLAGQLLPPPDNVRPEQPFEYRGYYRLGSRVVFSYQIGGVEYLDSPWIKGKKFERVVAPASEHPLRHALDGGLPQWPQEIATTGTLGNGHPYAVDTIELPFENPWRALLFITDHDFHSDGSAFICTMQGDVWHVTGLDQELANVRWRRFASGLHQPLGLVVKDDQVFVLGRDQITRLHDLNHDGEADFYECVSNVFETSASGHDFTCGLACDRDNRFYTASGMQGLLRITPSEKKVEVLATGFRNPDGVTLLPDASMTLPCSEGEWTPASMICLVPAHQEAIAPPHFGYSGPKNDQPPSLPLAYLPRGIDNNSGGQTVVPDDRWGPLRGQLIHFSSGQGSHFLVLRDQVAGQWQGAVVPLVGDFRSGVHRGKFNPVDGQLYVSGLSGWGSYTPDDGCFQRVRFAGGPAQLPRSFHVHENGVLIGFTRPVDPKEVRDLSQQFAQVWNYRYSPAYGSQEFAPSHPGVVGHEVLSIAGIHVVDENTIFVEMSDIQPVNQLHLLLHVDGGRPQELFVTVHELDKPYSNFEGYRPIEKTIAAHPLAVDLARLGNSMPNPWKAVQPDSVPLAIEAGKNLTFSTRELKAKRGQTICLTFSNPDAVPHNWVLVKPDSLQRVGEQANKFIADPEAVLHHYVPPSDDVLAYTDIVEPSQQFTIYFRAPEQPGHYPYLCTFPGHWMVMNGKLIVE